MNQDNVVKRQIDVEKIASDNPAINATRFKKWRRKMERIERLGLEVEKQQPQEKKPSVPNGLGLLRVGNLSRQVFRASGKR